MENATKALLIAASILIALILIATAMRTVRVTKEPADNLEDTMVATSVTMFNNQFTPHIGPNGQRVKTVEDAKALLSKVAANNSNNDRKIAVTMVLNHRISNNNVNSRYEYCNKTTDPQKIANLIPVISCEKAPGVKLYIMATKGWGTSSWTSGYDSEGYLSHIMIFDRAHNLDEQGAY